MPVHWKSPCRWFSPQIYGWRADAGNSTVRSLLRITDRGDRQFVLGPTHEEVVTDIIRNEVTSYKQLPLNVFQIQTKFRDEVRPRFGVMRSREFIMKDAYSFHLTQDSLQETYDTMYQAYSKIFNRIGLDFRAVMADTGSIGGSASHEFQVLAQSGEDDVIFSSESDYAANIELAEAVCNITERPAPQKAMELVDTPNAKTIAEAWLNSLICRLRKPSKP